MHATPHHNLYASTCVHSQILTVIPIETFLESFTEYSPPFLSPNEHLDCLPNALDNYLTNLNNYDKIYLLSHLDGKLGLPLALCISLTISPHFKSTAVMFYLADQTYDMVSQWIRYLQTLGASLATFVAFTFPPTS